jgi:8-oxo-dGTP diphosphatase
MEKTEIFLSCPEDFDVNAIVAGGFITHESKFLMLKRHPEKHYGNHWNLPAGKVELGEDPLIGAQREIHEETGLFIPLESLEPVQVFYIKRADFRIQFHVFKATLSEFPKLKLKLDENTDALWLTHHEALKLPLLGGGKEILDFCLEL